MQSSNDHPSMLSRRNFLVVGGTGAAAVLAYQWLTGAPAYAGDSLTVEQAHKKAVDKSVILIDIRRPDEWKRTGVGDGAHPIDMRRDDFVEALIKVAGPDRDTPIALICARGVRSARLSNKLSEAGFTNILDVPEGMLGSKAGPGWLAEKLPVTSPSEASN